RICQPIASRIMPAAACSARIVRVFFIIVIIYWIGTDDISSTGLAPMTYHLLDWHGRHIPPGWQ
ncbi:MAG: hypothetical protein WAK97_06575, partial [Pseudolabrys sp.]